VPPAAIRYLVDLNFMNMNFLLAPGCCAIILALAIGRCALGTALAAPAIDMRLQSFGSAICVDIKSVFHQAWDWGTQQRAADCEHQAVIGQRLTFASHVAGDLSGSEIDFGDVADDAVDADWLQYISQGYPDIVETRLVVSNADAMPVVAIDERDADFIRRNSALVEEPGGAGGAEPRASQISFTSGPM